MLKINQKIMRIGGGIKRAFQPSKDVNVLIEEIHNEFDSSTDRLLEEANAILAKDTNTAKGEMLSKLGFVNSKPSKDAELDIKIKKEKQELAENIRYYQQWYPNNKYITEAEVEKICKKYGLLCGDVKYYIGDVPDKNLIEISDFKLREEDGVKHICGWYERHDSHWGYRYYLVGIKTESAKYGWVETSNGGFHILHRVEESTDAYYEKLPLKICATVKDFDVKNMKIENGYRLEQNLPDPIVLQPVKNGYLIVSKWGIEATDETILNEKMN